MDKIVKSFTQWQKSPENVLKTEGLLDQIALYKYCTNTSVDPEELVGHLLLSNRKKYTRLLAKGVLSDEFL